MSSDEKTKYPYIKRFIKNYFFNKIKQYRLGLVFLIFTIVITITLPYLIGYGINILSETRIIYLDKDNQSKELKVQLSNIDTLTLKNNEQIKISEINSLKKNSQGVTIKILSKPLIQTNIKTKTLSIKEHEISIQNIIEINNSLSLQDKKETHLSCIYYTHSYNNIIFCT